MCKIMKALNYCHANNTMHRDIKPQNIAVGDDGEFKLVDFGFAHSMKQEKEKLEVMGTPYYIAPEVFSKNYGIECDIWSMGVVLYQMMSGKMPFDGSSVKEVFENIKKGQFDMPEHFSDELKDLVS